MVYTSMKRRLNTMRSGSGIENRASNGSLSSSSGPPSHHGSRDPAVRASSFSVGEMDDDGGVLSLGRGGFGGGGPSDDDNNSINSKEDKVDDRYNYALLIVLYTLQGIPMGLSASIPFLIQQKVKLMTTMAAAAAGGDAASTASAVGSAAAHAAKLSYSANAIFALCSWPFSLKLLWAPIVDSVYFKRFGRRKSWLVPVQTAAGIVMVLGANFVERQLGLGSLGTEAGRTGQQSSRDLRKRNLAAAATNALGSVDENDDGSLMNVQGVTAFFFVLYFLMATQDIAGRFIEGILVRNASDRLT